MKLCYFYIIFTAFTLREIVAHDIQYKILNYFKGDTVRSFEERWQKYKIPLENAVLLALKETYGHKGMNVYIRKMRNPYEISKGYYHSDNQVQIILKDLELDNFPYIWMPQVTLSLPSNVLKVDASLSKMIVRCNYTVFRNLSNVIYDTKDHNYYKNSPFAFQQTKTVGQLGIIIEGCVLSGFTVATLNGPSVNLGHDNFNIYNCHHTFEIYNSGVQVPPVFASYYPDGEGLNIEQLLMNSLREELRPKLQAAMFSYINTTAIFGEYLSVIRYKQEDIFRQTATFMNDVTRNMNKITIQKSMSTVSMDDFKITWDDLLAESSLQEVKLNRMVLTGLDTVYSSHSGGPISVPMTYISEEIRFQILQVYGMVDFRGGKHASHNFSVEIKDTAVSVLMEMDMLRTGKQTVDKLLRKSIKDFKVTEWRSFEFSASGDENILLEALVTGYLLKTLPKYIVEHVSHVYYEAVKITNGKSHESEGLESSQVHEKSTEELIEIKEDGIDSHDLQVVVSGEEQDESEDKGPHSEISQKETDSSSHEQMHQIKTMDEDKTEENGEESNVHLDKSIGFEEITKENNTSASVEEVKSLTEEEVSNSEIKSDKESLSESLAEDDHVKSPTEQELSNSESKSEKEPSSESLAEDVDAVKSRTEQEVSNSKTKRDKESLSESLAEDVDEVKSLTEQEVSNSKSQSDKESLSESLVEDVDVIENSNDTEGHMSKVENKSLEPASSMVETVDSENITRGDSTHLSDNEIKSDF